MNRLTFYLAVALVGIVFGFLDAETREAGARHEGTPFWCVAVRWGLVIGLAVLHTELDRKQRTP